MTKQLTIDELTERTSGAYSFDSYTESGWKSAVKMLRLKGLNDREVEAFMRSKHTRWAGDMDSKRDYGRYNGVTIVAYLDKHPEYIEKAELDMLVAGTF